MKVNFGPQDSIYKIIKTLEKVPKSKTVEVFIDPQNSFFENLWWGKQVVNLLEKRGIDYKFVCKDFKTKDYFKNLGVDCEFDKFTVIISRLKKFKDFLFFAKSIHAQTLKKKNYMSFLIVVFEVFVVSIILYMLYSLISPHANIYIKPSYNLEEIAYNMRFYPENKKEEFDGSSHIGIPYKTGNISVNYSTTQSVEDIRYIHQPSSGRVNVVNTTPNSYSIVANTKFVTDNGRLFKSNDWFKIPAAQEGRQTTTTVTLTSMKRDENGKIMGERGNIQEGTRLYIRELNQSNYLKNIYAEAIEDFQGGEAESQGVVTENDLNTVKQQLKSYVYENRQSIVEDNIQKKNKNKKVILKKDDFYSYHTKDISFNASTGDDVGKVTGKIKANVKYRYVMRDDLKNALKKYLDERDPENLKLVNLDKKSMMMFDKYSFENYFVIPIKIDVVWGYNFNQDINNIKDRIKSKIIGKKVPDAKKEILSFPEVDVSIVKLSPPWYNHIPKLKSRIDIKINKN